MSVPNPVKAKRCRSPYCECPEGQCRNGYVDSRGDHARACMEKPEGATHYEPVSGVSGKMFRYYRLEGVTHRSMYLAEPINLYVWLKLIGKKWVRHTVAGDHLIPITF